MPSQRKQGSFFVFSFFSLEVLLSYKKCFIKIRDPKIIETYEAITNNEMEEFMKKNPSNFYLKSDTSKSVSQLFQK